MNKYDFFAFKFLAIFKYRAYKNLLRRMTELITFAPIIPV